MKHLKVLFIFLLIMESISAQNQDFDLQGHRGARGLLPENTIPAFKKALELGVKTLELDVVISADNKVVVSHEPYFSAEICLNELGHFIPEFREKELNIYKMTYDEIKDFNCGSKGNSKFPDQRPMPVVKPLLTDVIDTCEQYAAELGRAKPHYNIELKSQESLYGKYQPVPDEFTRIVFDALFGRVPKERVIIQSFDMNILRSWREHYYGFRMSLLVEEGGSPDKYIEALGFEPQIYSAYYRRLSKRKVRKLQERGIKVIPWTVNDVKKMEKMIKWNVDGLITDFPDRFVEHFDYKTP